MEGYEKYGVHEPDVNQCYANKFVLKSSFLEQIVSRTVRSRRSFVCGKVSDSLYSVESQTQTPLHH